MPSATATLAPIKMEGLPAILIALGTFLGVVAGGAWKMYLHLDGKREADRLASNTKREEWEAKQDRINCALRKELEATREELEAERKRVNLQWQYVVVLEAAMRHGGIEVPARPDGL